MSREAAEVAGAVRRLVRGLVRRARAGDTLALEELAYLSGLVPEAVTVAGHLLHEGVEGYSYADIASVTGVSRQAAQQRYSRLPESPETDWLLA